MAQLFHGVNTTNDITGSAIPLAAKQQLPDIILLKKQTSMIFIWLTLIGCLFAITPKEPIKTAADDIHKYFFIVLSEKIRLDV